jgi:hypothetical protein
MKNGLKSCLLILSAAIILTGCASFKNNEVANVESLPDVSHYQNKPSVFVKARFFHGAPDSTPGEISINKAQIQDLIGKTLGESGLFSKYSFNEADQAGIDYTLHVDIYNHANMGAGVVSGVITGLSLYIIPGAATDNYTLNTKLTDRAGSVIGEVTNKDSITTWLGIWFIPFAANTPGKAFSQTVENQLKAVLKELVESGKLKYSQICPNPGLYGLYAFTGMQTQF